MEKNKIFQEEISYYDIPEDKRFLPKIEFYLNKYIRGERKVGTPSFNSNSTNETFVAYYKNYCRQKIKAYFGLREPTQSTNDAVGTGGSTKIDYMSNSDDFSPEDLNEDIEKFYNSLDFQSIILKAEKWAMQMNKRGSSSNITLDSDQSPFKTIIVAIEILVNAYAQGNGTEYYLKNTGEKFIVNKKNIEGAIATALNPTLYSFPYLISKPESKKGAGDGFTVTPQMLAEPPKEGSMAIMDTLLQWTVGNMVHQGSLDYFTNLTGDDSVVPIRIIPRITKRASVKRGENIAEMTAYINAIGIKIDEAGLIANPLLNGYFKLMSNIVAENQMSSVSERNKEAIQRYESGKIDEDGKQFFENLWKGYEDKFESLKPLLSKRTKDMKVSIRKVLFIDKKVDVLRILTELKIPSKIHGLMLEYVLSSPTVVNKLKSDILGFHDTYEQPVEDVPDTKKTNVGNSNIDNYGGYEDDSPEEVEMMSTADYDELEARGLTEEIEDGENEMYPWETAEDYKNFPSLAPLLKNPTIENATEAVNETRKFIKKILWETFLKKM